MTARRALSVAMALMLALAGCGRPSPVLVQLRNAQPEGGAYPVSLTALYLEFAEQRQKEGDREVSDYFARKGLAVSRGEIVEAESLEGRKLPEGAAPSLSLAREALLAAQSEENIATKPVAMARVQYFYDCWVDRAVDRSARAVDLEYCQQGFYSVMEEIKPRPHTPSSASAQPAQRGDGEQEALPAPVIADSYILYYATGSMEVSGEGVAALNKAIAEAGRANGARLVINGHTDRVGDETLNMEVSQARAEKIKNAMVRAGMDAGAIEIYAFGESDPKVPTADEVAEPANRRVEILINP